VTEDHDDFAFEPVAGLPEVLPDGEKLLWQGSPQWRALAVSAFHARKVAIYFALLLAWQLASAWRDGASVLDMMVLSAWTVALGAGAVAILCALAFLYARGTIYTLTSKRIVIRSGLALPVTLNLPLALIDTASVGGSGNIALAVSKPNRIAWLVLWPNVRPWTFNNPQPLLRALEDAGTVAPMLARALEADGGQRRQAAPRNVAQEQSNRPAPSGTPQAA
jgi:hypothetical protein